jgi:hypothetical protein
MLLRLSADFAFLILKSGLLLVLRWYPDRSLLRIRIARWTLRWQGLLLHGILLMVLLKLLGRVLVARLVRSGWGASLTVRSNETMRRLLALKTCPVSLNLVRDPKSTPDNVGPCKQEVGEGNHL